MQRLIRGHSPRCPATGLALAYGGLSLNISQLREEMERGTPEFLADALDEDRLIHNLADHLVGSAAEIAAGARDAYDEGELEKATGAAWDALMGDEFYDEGLWAFDPSAVTSCAWDAFVYAVESANVMGCCGYIVLVGRHAGGTGAVLAAEHLNSVGVGVDHLLLEELREIPKFKPPSLLGFLGLKSLGGVLPFLASEVVAFVAGQATTVTAKWVHRLHSFKKFVKVRQKARLFGVLGHSRSAAVALDVAAGRVADVAADALEQAAKPQREGEAIRVTRVGKDVGVVTNVLPTDAQGQVESSRVVWGSRHWQYRDSKYRIRDLLYARPGVSVESGTRPIIENLGRLAGGVAADWATPINACRPSLTCTDALAESALTLIKARLDALGPKNACTSVQKALVESSLAGLVVALRSRGSAALDVLATVREGIDDYLDELRKRWYTSVIRMKASSVWSYSVPTGVIHRVPPREYILEDFTLQAMANDFLQDESRDSLPLFGIDDYVPSPRVAAEVQAKSKAMMKSTQFFGDKYHIKDVDAWVESWMYRFRHAMWLTLRKAEEDLMKICEED